MADAMKLQQSLQESSVLGTPKTEIGVEIEDSFPAPPVSPEHPDLVSNGGRVSDLDGGLNRVKPVVWTPTKGKYRCSRCGRCGHNRRTCHGPVFY
ncbi:hypothetical protein CRYUN_Cryun01aG0232500 [Craigia yunnanensis]